MMERIEMINYETSSKPFLCYRLSDTLIRSIKGSHGCINIELSHELIPLFPILEWVLWERQAGAGNSGDWNASMNEVCTFSTIEDFWRYFNHIPKPSEIFFDGETRKKVGPSNAPVLEYNLFKRGIEPEWGDPQNSTGGSFYIRQALEMNTLDLYWQNLVMGVIGETIENNTDGTADKNGKNCICGVRVVDKSRGMPIFRVELWMNTRDADVKERIKKNLTDCLVDGLGPAMGPASKGFPRFVFKDHST
jgi:hypothetical protein